MIKAGIVGGTGYTGAELLRVLAGHPEVDVSVITSRAEQGKRVDQLFPSLRGLSNLVFVEPSEDVLLDCDVIFFATPHGVAQSMMRPLIEKGARVIDLSADFRIKDIELWQRWYGQAHACPDFVDTAVYGLPEFNRESIRTAQLVACPGCYPTSVQLALMPILKADWLDAPRVIVNAASGISGAGRNAKTGLLLAENYGSYKAYAVAGHRHLPEIQQGLKAMCPSDAMSPSVTFVPHLLPTVRGIHSTIYVECGHALDDVVALYREAYASEPFVDVLEQGVYPETRTVNGTNMCRISIERAPDSNVLVIMSVIDNLAKGASTQAIQNLNLMFGFDEALGLDGIALLP